MGQELKLPEDFFSNVASITPFEEAAFDMSYDVADWLECAAHFFHVRFLRDEHQMLWTASKCMDLRLFAPLPGQEAFDMEEIYEPLRTILRWMTKGGVPNVPSIDTVYAQAVLLATNMKTDITDFYNGCARPEQACHRWHSRSEDGTYGSRSGTIIQKDIWTKPRLSSQSPAFLWVYNHCLLKTANEAVVEGMCKFISQQADTVRGLSFQRYAKKGIQPIPPFCPSNYSLFLCFPGMRTRQESCGMDHYNTRQMSSLRNALTTTSAKGSRGIFTAWIRRSDPWSAMCLR
jgi:hypothetical protein